MIRSHLRGILSCIRKPWKLTKITNLLRLIECLVIIFCLLFSATFISVAQTSRNYAPVEELLRQGQFDQSISLLSRILAAEPRSVQAHNLLGIALTGIHELPKADAEYRRALRIQPGFVPAMKNLAINELAENDPASALKHFNAALHLMPRDPVIHAYLGKMAYSRRDYHEAIIHLEKSGELLKDPSVASELMESDLQTGQPQKARAVMVGLDPSKLTPQWQFRLGLGLAQQEWFEEAIPFFQSVNAKAPEANDAAFNLAMCDIETRRFPQAVETLRHIVEQGHSTAEVNNLLAEAYEGNQQTQEAINSLREAVRLAPGDENSYVNLIALCIKYEAFDLGLEIVQAGLQYHPQSDRLIFQRGAIHAMRSQFDLAQKDFQLAGELAPDKNLSYVALGVSYMQTGNLAKAIDFLRQRIQEKPDDSALQYFLGEALIRSGATPGASDFADAKAALEKSVELNSKFATAQIELGKIYLKEDLVDQALQHLELAHTLDPREKATYSALAIAYRRKGKLDLANAMLATLNKLNDEERKGNPRLLRLRVVPDDASHSETDQ